MATQFHDMEEAISFAKTMADRMDAKYTVTAFRGRLRVVKYYPGLPKFRIIWRSWGRRVPAAIADNAYNRKVLEGNYATEAARILGVSYAQVIYALEKYNWVRKPYFGKTITVEELRAAMTEMSVKDFSAKLGVFPARVYAMCRDHNIKCPHNVGKGKYKRGSV